MKYLLDEYVESNPPLSFKRCIDSVQIIDSVRPPLVPWTKASHGEKHSFRDGHTFCLHCPYVPTRVGSLLQHTRAYVPQSLLTDLDASFDFVTIYTVHHTSYFDCLLGF